MKSNNTDRQSSRKLLAAKFTQPLVQTVGSNQQNHLSYRYSFSTIPSPTWGNSNTGIVLEQGGNGARVVQKLVPSAVIGAPGNNAGSLRGISYGERRSSQQNMLTTGGLTSVLAGGEQVLMSSTGNNVSLAAAGGGATSKNDPNNLQTLDDSEGNHADKEVPSTGYRNATQISLGDRVMITDSPDEPGVPFVYRTPEERAYNMQRLNLDKRKLEKVPILQGEEELRLLNFQHNLITKLERLDSFRKLVFIDLYNNRIEEIEGLDELRGLRVLMLGKNRIRSISNLQSLHKLDVLDLHGNFIVDIENLNHLSELRVLNLAGNQIQFVDNLAGLDSLAELNLRRNVITHVRDIEKLPVLQRLFLSFNKIESLNDMQSLTGSQSLLEVTLDGNPVSDNPSTTSTDALAQQGSTRSGMQQGSVVTYRQKLICQIPNLRQLDMKRISDEERRSAMMATRKEEEKMKELARSQAMKEKKRAAIANAAKQWDELMRQHQEISGSSTATPTSVLLQQQYQSNSRGANSNRGTSRGSGSGGSNKLPALDVNSNSTTNSASGGSSVPTSNSRAESARSRSSNYEGIGDRLNSGESTTTTTGYASGSGEQRVYNRHSVGSITIASGTGPTSAGECDISNCHLADLDGEVLNLYGSGAIPALDKNWGVQAASHVTTVSFKFIDFDQISPHFAKIRARFPNVHTMVFEETNVRHMHQLNALAQLRKLDHLVIKKNGNPLVNNMQLWRYYALHRLSHFNIRRINETPVTQEDLVEADKLFGDLVSVLNCTVSASAIASANSSANSSSGGTGGGGGSSTTPRVNSADVTRSSKRHTNSNPLTSSDSDLKRVTVGGVGCTRGGFTNPLQFMPEDRKIILDNDLTCAKSASSKLVTNCMRDALSIEHKQRVLDGTWDKLFNQLVANYVSQMVDYRSFINRSLKEIDVSDI